MGDPAQTPGRLTKGRAVPGVADPISATWKVSKRAGLSEPFGAPEEHGKIKVVGKDGKERWLQDAS